MRPVTVADPLEVSFPRTLKLLAAAKLRRQSGVVIAATFLFLGWFLWFLLGRVSIYAISQQARFEAERVALPFQSSVDGVVLSCNTSLSQHVREGEVLIQLNAHAMELQRSEAVANLNADLADISSLQAEIEAQEKARIAISELVGSTARAGQARVSVSRTTAQFKAEESDVLNKLSEQELASKLDKLRSQEEKEMNRGEVAVASTQAKRETMTQQAALLDRDAQISALQKAFIDAQSQADVLRAIVSKLDYEIDRRSLRATSAGTLIDIVPCTVGMNVNPEERLATILPDSEIKIVSFFDPKDSNGRLKEGQQAVLRVDNFPWTQYGTVGATVTRVGIEPRDGLVRVELKVTKPNPVIPVSHGLTGLAEVEIERVTPFQLLLRTVGKSLAPTSVVPPPGDKN